MSERVVILGCGYVGLELGRRLLPEYDVIGVRRSEEGIDAVESAGLTGIRADVTDPASLAEIPDADIVVFTASSGGRGAESAERTYVDGQRITIDHFATRANSPDRYIYTSSTGVYGDHDGAWVDEETTLDPTTDRGKALVEAERVALEHAQSAGIDRSVARVAGIYGPGRYGISRYLENPVPEGYVNRVHRDDVAGTLEFIISGDAVRNDVVLVVDDEPVDRWEFADWLADRCGHESPEKVTIESDTDASATGRRRRRANKRCSNEKLRDLGYEFSYPTYREGYADAIDSALDCE